MSTERERLRRRSTSYVPDYAPSAKQAEFLAAREREVLYGGGKGAGKSDAALRKAVQYVHVPYGACLILRRTYKELSKPGAIMDRSHRWWRPTDAHWDREKYCWTFPSGYRVQFGHLEHEENAFDYDGGEYQIVIFDELPRVRQTQYEHLLTIPRGPFNGVIPMQVLSTGTPGVPPGQAWVAERLVNTKHDKRRYIHATFRDNPGIDRVDYEEQLSQLSAVKRAQFMDGNWSIMDAGGKFRPEWFEIVDDWPRESRQVVAWDRAARAPTDDRPDPDYTVGVWMAIDDKGVVYVVDVARTRATPDRVEKLMRQTAELAGRHVPHALAQERGSAGIHMADHVQRNVLGGWSVKGFVETGDIEVRADPLSSAAEHGNVRLVRGPWNAAFLEELGAFPEWVHDDQVAASVLAYWYLTGGAMPNPVAQSSGAQRTATRRSTRGMF